MIEASAMLVGWKARWDSDATLTTLVPGGVWQRPVVRPFASPYADMKATAQPPVWTTGATYLQRWTLEVRVWSTAGAVDAGAISAAMNAVFNQALKNALSIVDAVKVLSLLPTAGTFAEPDKRKDRQEVLLSSSRFDILLQGAR